MHCLLTYYCLAERDLLGYSEMAEEDYDLMTVMLLRLGTEGESSENPLIRMLSILLSSGRTSEEKKQLLEKKFEISMTTEFDTEVQNMCNLSEGILMKGKILGSIEAYREMGLKDNQIATRIMEKYHLSKEDVEEYLLAKERV